MQTDKDLNSRLLDSKAQALSNSAWETDTERQNQRAKCLTCARPLIWHQGEPWLTAALIAAFRVGAEGFAAAIHDAAFIDVYEGWEEH